MEQKERNFRKVVRNGIMKLNDIPNKDYILSINFFEYGYCYSIKIFNEIVYQNGLNDTFGKFIKYIDLPYIRKISNDDLQNFYDMNKN